jgi:hypothetical protein
MLDSLLAPLLGQALAQVLSLLLSNGFFAVGVPLLLEWAKKSNKVPWLDEYSGRIVKISLGVAGALAAAGIQSSLDLTAGTFVISGLTQQGLGLFAVQVVQQLGLQELAYQWLIKGRRP